MSIHLGLIEAHLEGPHSESCDMSRNGVRIHSHLRAQLLRRRIVVEGGELDTALLCCFSNLEEGMRPANRLSIEQRPVSKHRPDQILALTGREQSEARLGLYEPLLRSIKTTPDLTDGSRVTLQRGYVSQAILKNRLQGQNCIIDATYPN